MEGQGFHGLLVRHEPESQLPEGLRQGLEPLHLFVGHGLRQGGVTHPVNARQGVGDKVVVGKHAGIAAGNGSDKLLVFRHVHHGIAAGDGAGVAADVLLDAAAHDAADIVVAGQGALGEAVPDGAAGKARDAADIVAVVTGNAAIATAPGDQAQLHPTADAAGIAALGRNGTHVFAAVHNGLQFIPPPLGQAAAGAVVLRVNGGFQAHGAGNAAHVQVGLHSAGVGAVRHPSVGDIA